MSLEIRCIDKARDFMALAPLWHRLVNETGQSSPFLSYDWFWCCWHGVSPQCHPEILVVEDSGTPLAIIPLMHWRAWVYGLPIRYIGFLECPFTPLVDVVITDHHDRVIGILLDHLAARSDWDIAWLQKLPAISPTLKALENLSTGRLYWRRAGEWLSPYVAIDGDWDRFCRAMDEPVTDPQRDSDDQSLHSANLRIEEYRTIDLRSPLLQEALATINSNNQTVQGVSIAAMARAPEFFRELTRRASKNGWLSLWALRLDGRVIALEYQLRANGRVQVLCAGDDPSYCDRLPKSTLRLSILRSFFRTGHFFEYSLGPRVQHDQLWWATGYHKAVDLKLYRPTLYADILYRLEM